MIFMICLIYDGNPNISLSDLSIRQRFGFCENHISIINQNRADVKQESEI